MKQIVSRNKKRVAEDFKSIPHKKRSIDHLNGEMIVLQGGFRTCLQKICIGGDPMFVPHRTFADKAREGVLDHCPRCNSAENGGQ